MANTVTDIERQLARFNVGYDHSFDVYLPLWPALMMRNAPAGAGAHDCGYDVDPSFIAAHIVYRGILYYKKVPGDCGQATALDTPIGQNVLKFGSLGLGTVAAGSTLALGATAGLSVGLGAATAGVGLLALPIMAIFQHHSQAVANEQGTICAVSVSANQAIPQIDAMVRSGQATAAQGIEIMAQLVAQLKAGLDPVSGQGSSGHPCNAGCCYHAALDAHLDFVKTYYPDISPLTGRIATAPGSYSGTGQASTQAALVDSASPPSGSPVISLSSNNRVLLLAAAGVALVFFLKGMK
jgi:hypothetical protein